MPHQGHIFNQIRAKKLKERKGKMDGGLLFSPMRGMTCQCVCGISLRHDSNYVRHIIARVFPNVYMCKSTHTHILIPQNTSVKPLQFCNVLSTAVYISFQDGGAFAGAELNNADVWSHPLHLCLTWTPTSITHPRSGEWTAQGTAIVISEMERANVLSSTSWSPFGFAPSLPSIHSTDLELRCTDCNTEGV